MHEEKDLLLAFLRTDFKAFVEKVFSEVSPNSMYSDNWHIDVICDSLENVRMGKQNKLLVNIPPRYMKSIICSIAYPAWILGQNPKANIICVSYAESLSEKLALDCKRVMEAPWYQELFPATKLSKNRRSISDFETTRGGGRFSTTVNGTLTGRGGDYLIVDDPIKPGDASSDLMRTKINEWYSDTLLSRLNDKRNGKIIVIMQRVHLGDLSGYLLETDHSFKHVCMPVIAEEDEVWETGHRIFRREKGEALHPERDTASALMKIKADMGEYSFFGQYQQSPIPRGGGIIKKKWLQYYSEIPKFDTVVLSWDTANTVSELSDYSVCLVFGIKYPESRDTVNRTKFFLLGCFRERLAFPNLLEKVQQLHLEAEKTYKTNTTTLIEDKASGTQLCQILAAERGVRLQKVAPSHSKEMRLSNVSHLVENGSVVFPDNNPHWWDIFYAELITFPQSKKKDQVDAFSQFLEVSDTFKRHSTSQIFSGLYD